MLFKKMFMGQLVNEITNLANLFHLEILLFSRNVERYSMVKFIGLKKFESVQVRSQCKNLYYINVTSATLLTLNRTYNTSSEYSLTEIVR